MNETQTVFLVFFAIIWGAVANVQGRWKAFHWPFVRKNKKARHRLGLSMFYLNFVPITYITVALWCLSGKSTNGTWSFYTTIQVLLFGIFPAFAGFAPYRLWLSAIEKHPSRYYKQHNGGLACEYKTEENGASKRPALQITQAASRGNYWTGVGYLAFGALFLIIKIMIKIYT